MTKPIARDPIYRRRVFNEVEDVCQVVTGHDKFYIDGTEIEGFLDGDMTL